MLTRLATSVVNHLLSQEDWARDRLALFAGQTVQITLGTLVLALEITAGGLFAAGDKNATATVSITLPPDAASRVLSDRASLFAAARISGPAELAECLGFVFRNLHWDSESDLARLVGDIAAHRLVTGGKQMLDWPRQQARNLAFNLAEYFSEENPSIMGARDVAKFCADVDSLLESLEQLEKRIAALEISTV